MAETKETKEVAVKGQTLDALLEWKLDKEQEALPQGFNKRKFISNAIEVIKHNPDLALMAKADNKNGRMQLMSCLTRAALLDLDAANKEFYLVKYGNSLEFMISPKGARRLIVKYSHKPVKDVSAFVVREGDEFTYTDEGGNKTFTFKPKPFNDGEIVGAVAYAKFEDDTLQVEILNKKDIEAARGQSKAKNSPSWSRFYDQMSIKVAIHRLSKSITLDFENAMQADSLVSGIEIENNKVSAKKADNPFEEQEQDVYVDAEVIEEGADNAENA